MIRRSLSQFVGETVVVHQRGPSIRGVLLAAYKDCFVLAHAFHLDDQAKLAGETVVPRASGVWLQTRLPLEPDA